MRIKGFFYYLSSLRALRLCGEKEVFHLGILAHFRHCFLHADSCLLTSPMDTGRSMPFLSNDQQSQVGNEIENQKDNFDDPVKSRETDDKVKSFKFKARKS